MRSVWAVASQPEVHWHPYGRSCASRFRSLAAPTSRPVTAAALKPSTVPPVFNVHPPPQSLTRTKPCPGRHAVVVSFSIYQVLKVIIVPCGMQYWGVPSTLNSPTCNSEHSSQAQHGQAHSSSHVSGHGRPARDLALSMATHTSQDAVCSAC